MTAPTLSPATVRTSTGTDVAAAAALVVFWSSGFIGARLGTEHAPADTLLTWRYLLAALIVVPLAAHRLPRLGRRSLTQHAIVGVLSQAMYLGGVVTGVGAGVPAGTAALIAALQPLVVANAARRWLGEPVTARRRLGLWLGFTGVGLVVADDLTATDVDAWAYLLPLGGMLALSAGTVLQQRWQPAGGLVESMTVHTIASALLIGTEAAAFGRLDVPAAAGFWWAVVWVLVLSTAGGYGAYLLVLRRNGATRVSALLYLTPPTTLIWSWAMFDDGIGVRSLAGLVVCAVAVWLVLATRHGVGPSGAG
ncbi:drug/metabolite transporter (DMT)-like permease [Haloactinopolyspora alba]|uniref:Drug/metabolite transporter (DMT)-like permease n=1 Tax=Haloactinopolyspora alba TaxID=648780 RepID=A0A2P8EAZ6_9ACTN|nr:DMT family transporter [Haloactinopolyspora alba]PSL06646.1 drug/metabolite transporter (DMT)-like permease [Haloactinopolyspora alba]